MTCNFLHTLLDRAVIRFKEAYKHHIGKRSMWVGTEISVLTHLWNIQGSTGMGPWITHLSSVSNEDGNFVWIDNQQCLLIYHYLIKIVQRRIKNVYIF